MDENRFRSTARVVSVYFLVILLFLPQHCLVNNNNNDDDNNNNNNNNPGNSNWNIGMVNVQVNL